jgi:hypothetical protein
MKHTVLVYSLIIITSASTACGLTAETAELAQPPVRFVTVTPEPPPATPVPSAEPEAKIPAKNAEPGQVVLSDIAPDAGLQFRHGAFRESIDKDPAAMMGGGLCWLDSDGDGWLDLYVVNSHATHEIDYWAGQGGLPRNALFKNQGDGTFIDISASSGSDLALRGNGCVAGDIDQDGDSDIYVTADGPNALLLNQGNGTFVEGAGPAGIASPEWNSAAAMGDYDGDGLIDLFVASYIDLENAVPEPAGLFPQDYYGLTDHLYRNRGNGTFEDIALEAGLTHQERGLGALFSDLDQDGDLDLYVANDGHPNRLYLNQGDGTFREDSHQMGVDDRGSGMGVSAGDYDGDGWPDLVVTNFGREYNALYRNEALQDGSLAFEYASFRMGLQGFGRDQTGWGVSWLDLDRDSYLDLITVQGKVPITDLATDGEQIRIYRNRGDKTFRDVSRAAGASEIGPRLARGMAAADYDNDGDLDVAIGTIGGSLALLQNEGAAGNWLTVALDQFHPGTKVRATLPDGRILVRELRCGSSYLASEDPRLHFGLGSADRVKAVAVILPDGTQVEFQDVPANQFLTVAVPKPAETGPNVSQ